MRYHVPPEGFSKGTWQGLAVFAVVALVLLLFTGVGNVDPESGLANVLDLIAGVGLAVAVVWVVGGTIELQHKLVDFGLKATGGAALVVLAILWWQPISGARPTPEWNTSVELPEDGSLGFIFEEIERQKREGITDWRIEFEGSRGLIWALRPVPEGRGQVTYRGDDWGDIFRRIAGDAECLEVEIEESRRVIGLDVKEEETRRRDEEGAGLRLWCTWD